tara:strand:- start:346 stop:546 length:201 start_codon:yes stop_codon:yes gene_type:complete
MTKEPTLKPEFKAFKDGVYDALIYGTYDESVKVNTHYYKRGYDFGMVLQSDMLAEVNWRLNEGEEE